MLQSCKAFAPGSQFKLSGVNNLILMDATSIQLCLDVFPWATYMQTKGALKLHFGLNDNGYLPDFIVATPGKVHEINVAKSLDYQLGSMICMDRGYTDYDWWEELTRLCLYLILAFIRFICKTVHSMRENLNGLRINLFSNEILDDYLVPKMMEPIVNPQLTLF